MKPETDCFRRLVLLRHATAKRGGPDADEARMLTPSGGQQSVRIAAALTQRDLIPELVLCSSAMRAQETWDVVRDGLQDIEPEEVVTTELYQAGVAELLARVQEVEDQVRTVLVVGHEPTLSRAASRLACEGSDEAALAHVREGISTGTFLVLEFDGHWADLGRHSARLRTVVMTPETHRWRVS